MRKIGIVILFVLIPLLITAQSIVWQLKPTDYSDITRFGPNLYQVEKGGKMGLIHSDGSEVIPVSYDRITDFYEGRALVIANDNGKERVLGYLSDKGIYTSFSSKYYTLAGQAFYSDGMLSVSDSNGKPGYLDENGTAVLGFDGSWTKIKPFTEGYASVFKKDKYSLIDKDGRPVRFIIGVGAVYGGCNVNNGKALIWDENGKFYQYDVQTEKCSSAKKPSQTQFDYLYCFMSISNRGKQPPYYSFPSGKKGLMPVSAGSQFGYSKNGKVILPAQFDKAGEFEDGVAIVKLKGKSGILRYVEDGSDFIVSVPKSHHEYFQGKRVDCSFSLQTPEVWKNKNLEVVVTDSESGEIISTTGDSNMYSFGIIPQTSSRLYNVSVASEGLQLWSGKASYTFKKKEEQNLRVSLAVNSNKADENDKVYVYATITNPGSESVTATVSMSGSSSFNSISKTVTISAGASTQIGSYFKIQHTIKDQHVEVRTSKGGHASKTGLTLMGFYD